MSISHNQQRYEDLQKLLTEQYERLAYFERDLGITADTAKQFELKQKITGIKQTIEGHQEEQAQLEALLKTAPGSSPSGNPTPLPPSMLKQVKKEALEKRLVLLSEQYRAASSQFNISLDAAQKVVMSAHIKDIEEEIQKTESELNNLK